VKIAIDASSAAKAAITGIGTYIRALVHGLAEIDPDNTYYICNRLSRWRRRKHFLRVDRPNFRNKLIQEPFHLLFMPRLDVFHGPDARLPACGRARSVVTFHDVFSLVSDQFSDEAFRRKKRARYLELVQRATCILADSESTRQDMIRHLDADAARVRVVPLGVSSDFWPRPPEEQAAVRRKYGLEGDFILYVGVITRRKNTRRVIEAFGRVARERSLTLVLAGRPGYQSEDELAPIDELGLGERVKLAGYVAAEDLPALYSAARLFLFPSLYEGFGIPILEAMACGTPVVTSACSSMPEVAGEAAVLVDPYDVDAIAGGVRRLLDDEGLRHRLRGAGIERARLFPWTRTARETLRAYRDVCAGPSPLATSRQT